MKKIKEIVKSLHNGELTIIGARPGLGKSTMAFNIITNVAMSTKVAIVLFSLEGDKKYVLLRIQSIIGNIAVSKIIENKLNKDENVRLAMAYNVLNNMNLKIVDKAGVSIEYIRLMCRNINIEEELGLVVIDYFQLLSNKDNKLSRIVDEYNLFKALKELAKEFNVPVLVTYLLSKDKVINKIEDINENVDNIIIISKTKDKDIVNVKNIRRDGVKEDNLLYNGGVGSYL